MQNVVESTGIYWIPLFELLERQGFHVILVDPKQTRRSGRPKTDVLDCQWIWRLHATGILSASFRPTDLICEFRGYLRRRLTLAQDAGRYIQQMQKALNQMNVPLDLAVSDITGKTGLSIIKAIVCMGSHASAGTFELWVLYVVGRQPNSKKRFVFQDAKTQRIATHEPWPAQLNDRTADETSRTRSN